MNPDFFIFRNFLKKYFHVLAKFHRAVCRINKDIYYLKLHQAAKQLLIIFGMSKKIIRINEKLPKTNCFIYKLVFGIRTFFHHQPVSQLTDVLHRKQICLRYAKHENFYQSTTKAPLQWTCFANVFFCGICVVAIFMVYGNGRQ